jgi:hypothetical protein
MVKPTDIEAWFKSNCDKASWPTGPYSVQMHANEPFRVTNPEAIAFFNDVAEHNEWLKKVPNANIPKSKDVATPVSASASMPDIIRGFESKLHDQTTKADVLEKENESLKSEVKKLEVLKDQYDRQTKDLARLQKALDKARRNEPQPIEEKEPK